jgi:hypothetical protein
MKTFCQINLFLIPQWVELYLLLSSEVFNTFHIFELFITYLFIVPAGNNHKSSDFILN